MSEIKNIFKILFHEKGNRDSNPRETASVMATEFQNDLTGRLRIVIEQNLDEAVRFKIHIGYIKETSESQLSIKVGMNPDAIDFPVATAQQIVNTFWGTENQSQFAGKFRKKVIIDSIGLYYRTSGLVKLGKKKLTTQINYIFK